MGLNAPDMRCGANARSGTATVAHFEFFGYFYWFLRGGGSVCPASVETAVEPSAFNLSFCLFLPPKLIFYLSLSLLYLLAVVLTNSHTDYCLFCLLFIVSQKNL